MTARTTPAPSRRPLRNRAVRFAAATLRPGVLRRRPDDGASLLVALVFVTCSALVVGSLLAYASAAIGSASSTLAADQTNYDAGGALQLAIDDVRNSTDDDPSQPCLSNGWVDVPTAAGGTVRVVCQGGPGTGAAAGTVPLTTSNTPGSALLTLGGLGIEPGIDLESTGTLGVRGQVRVNSGISPGGSGSGISLVGSSTLEAKGLCFGVTITPSTSASCFHVPTSAADTASFTDPGYAPPSTALSALTYRRVPACTASTPQPVVLQPGYYDDADALNALTDTTGGRNSACTGRTLWFTPGQYYFDFHNRDVSLNGLTSLPQLGEDVWRITDSGVKVVAGTPDGWTASPYKAPTVPSACVSPLASASANTGVQFAFGGDSHVSVNGGQVEICGQYSSAHPPIAVYGITGGSTPAAASKVLTTTGSGRTPTGELPFTTTPTPSPAWSALKDQDCTLLAATCTAASVMTATLTRSARQAGAVVSGFSTAAIPAGSLVDPTATLLVTHRESTLSGALTVTASGTIDTGGSSPLTVKAQQLTSSLLYTTTAIPVTLSAAVLDDLHRGNDVLSDLQLDASMANPLTTATVSLDAVQLKVSHTPPAVRGESALIGGINCLQTPYPYTPNSSCALITTSGKPTRLFVQGTTYAPLAPLDLQLTNTSCDEFTSGLISRTVRVNVTASSTCTGPVFEVPDVSPGGGPAPYDVYFTAYTCTGNCTGVSPPTNPWKRIGQAIVTYSDSTFPIIPGSRTVTVRSWNLRR